MPLEREADASLWPAVERVVRSFGLAGIAVAVVKDGEVALSRGFGTRDLRTGDPVTPETMFHLASVSKPFVATAVVDLAAASVLDLDAPVIERLPELTLADGRQGEITARHLITHTSGIPDVVDYGWYDPQLGDDALEVFVRSLSGSSLRTTPGTVFSYCNAGFEVLGHLLSVVTGEPFERAMTRLVLGPAGMTRSTFLRADVPPELAASPHVGAPLGVPGDSYPYTRRHAPSSTLHSNLVELCRWMLDARTLEREWEPAVTVGDPPWEEHASLGMFLGTHRGHRTVGHSGSDPGFGSRLVLVPDERIGVVVLANSNNTPTGAVARAALDLALGARADDGLDELLPPITGPVATALAGSGRDAAIDLYRRLASVEPAAVDLDEEWFADAVWGAIELHRTELAWPFLDVWATVRPESSQAWTMTGWAHQVDGDDDQARTLFRRALDLDPENEEAAPLLGAPE